MEKNSKKIFTTNKYNMFKRLEGNRKVSDARVAIIKANIERVGYITNPIIVNEKYEIIEGQGRLKALKELNLPIDYIIHYGAGIEECIALNMKNTNWKLQDFIDSYAERGYISYERIKSLQEKYAYGLGVLATATKLLGKFDYSKVKDGSLEITEEEYMNAIERLEWIDTIAPYCKKCNGELTFLYQSLMICKEFSKIEEDKLKDRTISYNSTMLPFANIPDCMKALEEIYNRGRREINKVYIFTEYRQWLAKYKIGYKERIENGSYRKASLNYE